MSKGSDDWVVLVTSGLHEGAHAMLPDHAMQVLGTASDCEICLVDAELHARHCAISRYGDTFSLRSLNGDVRVDGQMVDGSVTLPSAGGAVIELGNSTALRVLPFERLDDARADLANPVDAHESVGRRRLSLGSTAAVSGVLLVCAAWVTAQDARQDLPEPVDPMVEIQATIDRLQMGSVISVSRDQGSLVLSGIAELKDIEVLRQEMTEQAGNTVFRLTTPEQLLEQVTGVFRTNGMDADLNYGGQGSVIVQNLDPEDSGVARVASFVRSDVPLLKNLGFKSVTPSGDQESGKTTYLPGPGKRLTTIVDGDVAYITTEDGARYFEGSVLPDGHRVHRISSLGIEVETDTGVSTLSF